MCAINFKIQAIEYWNMFRRVSENLQKFLMIRLDIDLNTFRFYLIIISAFIFNIGRYMFR